MDGPRFDELTKTLVAATPSRREALRRFMGGTLAAVVGGVALEEAGAQVGTEAFNLTCKQSGAKFYCQADANDVTECKSGACLCAEKRDGGGVCIKEPAGGCPTRKNKCNDSGDCGSGKVCIKVSQCCPNHPGRGKCVRKCPA